MSECIYLNHSPKIAIIKPHHYHGDGLISSCNLHNLNIKVKLMALVVDLQNMRPSSIEVIFNIFITCEGQTNLVVE